MIERRRVLIVLAVVATFKRSIKDVNYIYKLVLLYRREGKEEGARKKGKVVWIFCEYKRGRKGKAKEKGKEKKEGENRGEVC